MATNFKYLDVAFREDTLAANLISREQEVFFYEFNLELYQHQIANATDSTFKQELEQRIRDTNRELTKSKATYEALLAQVTDESAHLAAVARVRAKK